MNEAETFLAQCRREGKFVQPNENPCSRRWSDQVARRKYRHLCGHHIQSDNPLPPAGSIPLKAVLHEIAVEFGVAFKSLSHRWEKYGMPLVVVRRLRTRVDIDPRSVDAARQWMRNRMEKRK